MKYLNKIYYLILIIIIIGLLFSIPTGYNYLNDLNNETIESEVMLSLGDSDMTNKLNESTANHNYEVTVISEDYYYSTLNLDIDTMKLINFPDDYSQMNGQVDGYSYSIVVPPISFNDYYKYFAFVIILLIIAILLWNVLVVRSITKTLLKPLQTLKRNINNLKNYDFSNLEIESQDKINEELLRFSDDLSGLLSDYNEEITKAELDTYEKLDIIEKQKQYLITVVHDLKGEVINMKLRCNDEVLLKKMNKIITESEESIKFLMNNELHSFDEKQDIRMDVLIYNTITNKKEVVEDKELDISMNVGKKCIYENRHVINQLVNNLVSNAIRHTPDFGEIKVYESGKYIIFENDTTSDVDLSRIFDINYSSTSDAKIGYGMIRIKQIINNLGYSYDVKYLDNKFIFKLELRYIDE